MRFLYKALFWFVPWWYGFTMTVTRKRRWPEVARYFTPSSIAQAVRFGSGWRSDPIKGVLDVMMSPRKFQAHIDGDNEKLGDCDDHAIYWATALLKNRLADRAWLGTTWYKRPGAKRGVGHVVCVYELGGELYWADYRSPRYAGTSTWGWALDVALSRGAVLVAAGLIEVSLRKSGEPKLHKKVQVWT